MTNHEAHTEITMINNLSLEEVQAMYNVDTKEEIIDLIEEEIEIEEEEIEVIEYYSGIYGGYDNYLTGLEKSYY